MTASLSGSQSQQDSLSVEEWGVLERLMRRVTWPVQPGVFDAWCEKFITAPIELAVVRPGEKGWEVFMFLRPDSDPYFAGGLHMAGSVVLPGRNSSTVLPALVKREVGIELAALANKPEFIGHPVEFMKGTGPGQCARGQEASYLFVLRLTAEEAAKVPMKEDRAFYLIDNPPANTLPHHVVMIDMVRKHLATGRAWLETHEDLAVRVFQEIRTAQRNKQGMPPAIYEAFLPTHTKKSTELVIFDDTGRIYLVRRPSKEQKPSEPYPNQLHSPGVTHQTGETWETSFQRLRDTELGPNAVLIEPVFAGIKSVDDPVRGLYDLHIYVTRLEGGELMAGADAKFYKLSEIPQDELVASHRDIILPNAIVKARELGWIT